MICRTGVCEGLERRSLTAGARQITSRHRVPVRHFRKIPRAMLPGFRFLFAATMLSMSLLIFALGAAALLRSAHEEFASNPTWRATPEVTFAQAGDTTGSVLASLRVEVPVAEKSTDALSGAASTEE